MPAVKLTRGTMYAGVKEDLPEEDFVVPIGKAALRREGADLSIITSGARVYKALDAAEELAKEGVEVEVLDLRSLLPLDEEAILATAKKTSKIIVLHESTLTGGPGGEIVARIAQKAFEYLDGPIVRIAPPDTPVPYSPPLEEAFLPQVQGIVEKARELAAY